MRYRIRFRWCRGVFERFAVRGVDIGHQLSELAGEGLIFFSLTFKTIGALPLFVEANLGTNVNEEYSRALGECILMGEGGT